MSDINKNLLWIIRDPEAPEEKKEDELGKVESTMDDPTNKDDVSDTMSKGFLNEFGSIMSDSKDKGGKE